MFFQTKLFPYHELVTLKVISNFLVRIHHPNPRSQYYFNISFVS